MFVSCCTTKWMQPLHTFPNSARLCVTQQSHNALYIVFWQFDLVVCSHKISTNENLKKLKILSNICILYFRKCTWFERNKWGYTNGNPFTNFISKIKRQFNLVNSFWLSLKNCIWWSVISQISTSVQQTTEVVTLKPCALTLQATLPVHVYQDTPEMDSPAQVNIDML